MALYYDLNVFTDVYRLILKMVEDTQGFPREEKYTLGQDIKRDAIVLVRSMYRANKARSKTEDLEAFLDDVEILKLEVRPFRPSPPSISFQCKGCFRRRRESIPVSPYRCSALVYSGP